MPEVAFLADVAEARQCDISHSSAEKRQKAPDGLRAADRHDRHALRFEVPATAGGERAERNAVADPLDEHDCAGGRASWSIPAV